MRGPELVLVLRYREAVTYGFHALLGALGSTRPPPATRSASEHRGGDRPAHPKADGVSILVLWSHSQDAAALADELRQIRALANGPNVTHLAGGVQATAEPVQTLDAGWGVAAIGEGESTLLSLVDAKGDPASPAWPTARPPAS